MRSSRKAARNVRAIPTISATSSIRNNSVCLLADVPGTRAPSVALLITCAVTPGNALLADEEHEASLETTYSRYVHIWAVLTSPTALAMAHAPAGVVHVALTVTRLCARRELNAPPMAAVFCQSPRSGCGP